MLLQIVLWMFFYFSVVWVYKRVCMCGSISEKCTNQIIYKIKTMLYATFSLLENVRKKYTLALI